MFCTLVLSTVIIYLEVVRIITKCVRKDLCLAFKFCQHSLQFQPQAFPLLLDYLFLGTKEEKSYGTLARY